jgi:uncharacterized phage protein (TIGR02218 family)
VAFSTYERSIFAGRPVQLYEFLRTSGGVDYYWRYNGSDRDLTYLGETYAATAISDEGVKQTGEAVSSQFQITLPATVGFCDDFRASGPPPSDNIWAKVFRAHAQDIASIDTDLPVVGNAAVVWVGSVDGMVQTTDIEAHLNCSTLATSFQRKGLRYTWMKNCPHVLYAELTCKVDREAFRVDADPTVVVGNAITAAVFGEFEDGWFLGGFIEYTRWPSNYIERRMIIDHVGSVITVLGSPLGLRVGDLFSAFPGCKRTVRACIDKFANYDNYGGLPHLPGRNPFDGNPVF